MLRLLKLCVVLSQLKVLAGLCSNLIENVNILPGRNIDQNIFWGQDSPPVTMFISSDKLKPNTLLFQFPVLPAHGFDSDECTMRNISERDNLGRRTEFHLSAILKHLVGRNNAVVLVDDGKNQCSVKNHFVSFNVLLVSISFV